MDMDGPIWGAHAQKQNNPSAGSDWQNLRTGKNPQPYLQEGIDVSGTTGTAESEAWSLFAQLSMGPHGDLLWRTRSGHVYMGLVGQGVRSN